MISVSLTSTLIGLMVVIGASSIMINDAATKAPLMFSKWPPYPNNNKSPSLRNQIFQQLRSSGRIPPSMIVKRYPSSIPSIPSMPYMMRPMKYAQLKKTPLPAPSYYRPTISTPPRFRFQSSPPVPNGGGGGEYIFENPYTNYGYPPNKKKISLTDETKYNPIHTVPAPNLNKNLAYSTHAEYLPEAVDNTLFDQKEQFNQITFRPLTIPQYQVTEQINDHTVRIDPFTGRPKMYGVETAHSIPSYKIAQSFDSYNPASPVGSRPLPIEISFIPAQSQPQPSAPASTAPVAAPLIQLSNQVAQQQLPDTYALPIGNQPQLQQHLLQQQSMLQNMPVSVYNPTYLVTQSNNLLKQHREQLFKPAPAYLGSINQPTADLSSGNTQPLQDVNSVASPGQLLTSAQSQHKHIQHEHQAHQQQQNGIPLRPDFAQSVPQIDNTPTFQRFVADRPSNNFVVQQPVLTESELNNLLNIGSRDSEEQNRFVASTYFQQQQQQQQQHQQPDPQIEIDNRQRQHINDIKISQANEELHETFSSAEATNNPKSRKKTAHQEHQEKLAEQFSGKTALRIYVPDEEDYQKQKNEVRRSDIFRTQTKNDYINFRRDDFRGITDPIAVKNDYTTQRRDDFFVNSEPAEQKTDYSLSRQDEYRGRDEQDLQEFDDQETTTDGNDDYLSQDTESVDRLALDGETRDPMNSSTIDSYSYEP